MEPQPTPASQLAPGERRIASERRAQLAQLRSEGVDPYPCRYPGRVAIAEVRSTAAATPAAVGASEDAAQKPFRVAGRIVSRRRHGRTMRFDLVDRSGEIELLAQRDALGAKSYARLCALQLGDLVAGEGPIVADPDGGPSALSLTNWVLLAKSLRLMPDKHQGITAAQVRLRRRELDLLSSPSAREVVVTRSRAIAAIRSWFSEQGFLEIETPVLQPVYGGALARPFATHHNALDRDFYLRIASELYLKRCVVGGLDDVFTIGKCFRNEGLSSAHSPEFTLLEWYRVGIDYREAADLTEAIIATAAQSALGSTSIEWRGHQIDLAGPWRRATLAELVSQAIGCDVARADDATLTRMAGSSVDEHRRGSRHEDRRDQRRPASDRDRARSRAEILEELFAKRVQPELVQPTLVFDLPLSQWPVARRRPSEPDAAEAWELYIGGMEVGCGATDLNDPDEQQERFTAQQTTSPAGDEVPHPEDNDYVQALEHGLMPVGGSGIGLDRLVMLLTGRTSVREVVTFPLLKAAVGPSRQDRATTAP